MTANSFGSRAALRAGDADHAIYRLDAVPDAGSLPFSLKILLENLLRNEDGRQVTAVIRRPRLSEYGFPPEAMTARNASAMSRFVVI